MRCLNCGHTKLSTSAIDCPNCGVHLSALMRDCLPSGTVLQNAYRVEYPLGRGGFGITYYAHDIHLNNRPVAIKEFYPQEHAVREYTTGRLLVPHTKHDTYQRSLRRFLEEGAMLAKLSEKRNPGLVNVYASFQCRDTAYLVMEFIDGMTLRDKLNQQSGKLPEDQVKKIMSSLVDALKIAHQQQIYHLDIAPDNVMVTPDDRVVLIDFGASRQGLGTSTTQAYKEAYAPIEVIDGDGFGPWSDVFELGMMLHEMLTGKVPTKALSRVVRGNDHWVPDLPAPWQDFVARATRLYKEDRPQTVDEWWNGQKSEHKEERRPQQQQQQQQQQYRQQQPKQEQDQDQLLQPPHNPPAPLVQPAGFALRSMADLIDRTILIIAAAISHPAYGFVADSADIYLSQLLGVYILLALVYCPVMDSSPTQGTLGKMLLGIAVTDLHGRRIKLGRAYNRHICKIFSYLTLLIGFLMAGFTDRKQALHDRIAKCLVIKRIQHEYPAGRDS